MVVQSVVLQVPIDTASHPTWGACSQVDHSSCLLFPAFLSWAGLGVAAHVEVTK